ncbi:hypothetical protein PHYPSEUDO_008746 [Phytophthora pseudosyringae]|uniref:Uncharacterized protein n=1 Tax=Phytophthora pseudosyringae TaxID=221518 RepID=A0A8T1VGQ1_9STRA|nr:hypothetical protein PHYPSEUDO_008746 [Phytophthora pseudosyringae]
MARRETRREAEKFRARLEGRSAEEHFGGGDSSAQSAVGTVDSESAQAVGLARPRAPPIRRPRERTRLISPLRKSRLAAEAAAENSSASVGAKAKGKAKRPVKTKVTTKKVTKKAAAAKAREEKKAKEAKAVSRAIATTAWRAAEKEQERGRQKRKDAIAGKQPRSASPANAKQQKTTSPHVADDEVDEDADDERLDPASSADTLNLAPAASQCASCESHSREAATQARPTHAARSLFMGTDTVPQTEDLVEADADASRSGAVVPPEELNDMSSDMEGGEADSEEWYMESEGVEQPQEDIGGPDDEKEDDLSGESDGGSNNAAGKR